jgi:hypothetical protein
MTIYTISELIWFEMVLVHRATLMTGAPVTRASTVVALLPVSEKP